MSSYTSQRAAYLRSTGQAQPSAVQTVLGGIVFAAAIFAACIVF